MVKFIFLLMFLITSLFGVVNVNKANSAQLQTLNGIGPTKAGEILKYRKAHGAFKSVDELLEVKGIGPKTLQHIKSQVSIR